MQELFINANPDLHFEQRILFSIWSHLIHSLIILSQFSHIVLFLVKGK